MTYSIQEHVSLKSYNTFGVEVFAKRFVEITSDSQLLQLLKDFPDEEFFFLGGGSNILFTRDVEELVVYLNIRGIDIIKDDTQSIQVRVASGEDWHQFVLWSLKIGTSGIENLSLIPGNVGTSPIQNIGAYGVEVKDVIVSVKAIDRMTNQVVFLSNEACMFGYRNSLFKQNKKRYVITAVVFELSKVHQVNTSYGAIQEIISSKGIDNPTPKQVSDAVVSIRSSKLPDPSEIGSAGSFFKNPVMTQNDFESLQAKHGSNVPHYHTNGQDMVKVPAGWLIDTLGWKGKTFEGCGVHKDQALVLVNYGGASGSDIWNLAQEIQVSVQKEFGILLEPEVNIY